MKQAYIVSQNTMPEKMINTRGAVLDVEGKYSTDHAVTTCMYTAYKKYVHVKCLCTMEYKC